MISASEDMDRTILKEKVNPLVVPEMARCSTNSGVTESVVGAVISNNGKRPSSVSGTPTIKEAAPTSSFPNIRPRSQLNALVKNDAVPVVPKPLAETNSPTRVYVTDNDAEQRFKYLAIQDLDDIRNGAQRQKATNKKVFRKGLRNNSGAVSLLQNKSKPYFKIQGLNHITRKHVSVLGGHPKTHELRDSPGDTGQTVCDSMGHKAEYSVSGITAESINKAGKTRGTKDEAKYGVTYFAAGQMNHAGKIPGGSSRAEYSMPNAIAKQSNQTGEIEDEEIKAGHTVPIFAGEGMSQGGKKGAKKGAKKRSKKRKTNKKKAKMAKTDTNIDRVDGETQGNYSYAKEPKGGPGVGVRAHDSTEEFPTDLQRASKHRGKAVKSVKVDGKLSDNNIKTTLSMWHSHPIMADNIIDLR